MLTCVADIYFSLDSVISRDKSIFTVRIITSNKKSRTKRLQ